MSSQHWTKPRHGVQHLTDPSNVHRWATVVDSGASATLTCNHGIVGRRPDESNHASAKKAREAGEAFIAKSREGGVLAVLAEAHDWLYRGSESRGDDDLAEAVKRVRDDVAELIADSRDAAAVLQAKAGPLEQETVSRLYASLARVGGAS